MFEPFHPLIVYAHGVLNRSTAHVVIAFIACILCADAVGRIEDRAGSCKRVTRLARAALRPATSALEGVASISSDHNAERAIHRWAQRQAWRQLLPAVYQFQIVLNGKDNLGTSPGLSTHAALLPHG